VSQNSFEAVAKVGTEWMSRDFLAVLLKQWAEVSPQDQGATVLASNELRIWATFERDYGTVHKLLSPTSVPRMTTINSLIATEKAGDVRQKASVDHKRAGMVHRTHYLSQWTTRVKDLESTPVQDMLTSLYDSGFSWRDIARILDVSVAAVQKWRGRSGKMTVKNQAKLRYFVAGYNMVASHKVGVDTASWLDIPIVPGVPITPMDLWSFDNPVLFFENALAEDVEPERILDEYDIDWRPKYRDDGFETFTDSTGNIAIRMKDR